MASSRKRVRIGASLLSYFEVDLEHVEILGRLNGCWFSVGGADQKLIASLTDEANRADELSREPSLSGYERNFYRRAERSLQSLIEKTRQLPDH